MTAGEGMLPYLYDEEISKILLGSPGVPNPGKATISGLDRIPDWDDQKAKGSTGASTTLNDNNPPVTFSVLFELASDTFDGRENDFDRWESFQRLIESTTSGAQPFALPIYHPDLARLRITEVTNAGVGGRVYDGKGGASHTCKFKEYRPAQPKPSKKPGAKGAGGVAGKGVNASKPDPNAKAKAELAALVAEARKP